MVNEVVITSDGKEMIFRTTGGKTFEKEIKEQKFFQVLKDGSYPFIKMPVKIFTEANYKGAYAPTGDMMSMKQNTGTISLVPTTLFIRSS